MILFKIKENCNLSRLICISNQYFLLKYEMLPMEKVYSHLTISIKNHEEVNPLGFKETFSKISKIIKTYL